jgi:hypothetical protein
VHFPWEGNLCKCVAEAGCEGLRIEDEGLRRGIFAARILNLNLNLNPQSFILNPPRVVRTFIQLL